MKFKKSLILLLTLTLLFAAICIVAVTAANEAGDAKRDLKISAKTLELEDSIHIVYSVPVADTVGAESVKMLIWLEPQNEYTYGTQAYELSPNSATEVVEGEECHIFTFRELAAKHMTLDVYARVYVTDDNGAQYSSVEKYSILQYAYNMLGKTSTNVPSNDDKNLLNSMLEYGAAAQIRFGESTDRLANKSYYKINLENALLSDGTTHGLYLVGDTITVTAEESNSDGEDFLYWENSAGAQVSDELTYTITVQAKNETYTAVYGAAQAPVVDTLIYTELSDGTYSVKANKEVTLPQAIAIPATYNDKAVTVIEDNAFLDCTSVTSISLPHGIKTLGENAFSGCTGLSELLIPETVKTIGKRAFYGCTGLTDITIPASVTSIGTQIFYKASNLSTVYYNSTYSADNTFLNLSHIKKIVFGGTYIPSYILQSNTSVKEVEILNSVKSIGSAAFAGCSSLTSITIPDSVTSIVSTAFYGCTSLTSITIPDSVTSIGYQAFYNCSSLTSITIPDSVTSIVSSAFYGCSSLKDVYITDIEAWCNISFSDLSSNPMYYGANLYLNNELVTELELPDSVTSIGSSAFYGCSSLTSITIPDSVTSIGEWAFNGCSSLTSITIPDSVTSIGECAFRYCSSLETVYYGGTADDWENINIDYNNSYLTYATRYYYSETQPTTDGNWWHYVDGVPTKW